MEVKIRVGVQVDQSMRYAFRPLVQGAVEARRLIMGELGRIPKDVSAAFAAGGRGQSQVFKGVVSEARAAAAETRALAKQAEREITEEHRKAKREQAAIDRAAASLARQQSAALYREFVQQERDRERTLDRFATRTSHRATRFFWPNVPIMSLAGRAASGVIGGLGIDTSLSGAVSRGVQIQAAALQLSNRGHIEGAAGPNGAVVDPRVLEREARAISGKQAVDADEILHAQSAFVGLTGDLDLARRLMPQIVAETAASGGNQEEAAKAAAEFAAHLGDIPNKAQKVGTLLRIAAGQGKIGAVDFADFAKYAASAASAAPLYKGDEADNISKLTALAEIAKQHGGARNAAQAFQSISSLTNTLGKGARTKAIAKLLGGGETQWSDPGHFKDPFELVKSIVFAAKGDLGKIQAAVGDARAMTAIRGLGVTYNRAGGGAAGERGVEEELKKFKGAILSEAEIARANKARLETDAAKAKLFQQQLDQIVQTSATKLIPALEQLAPKALAVADMLGRLISWAAENPWTALEAALAASVARAGLESVFRTGLEAAIKSAAGAVMAGDGKGIARGGGLAIASALVTAEAGALLGEHVARSVRISNEGRSIAPFEDAARDPSRVSPEDRDKLLRNLMDSEEDLKARRAARAKVDPHNLSSWNPFNASFWDIGAANSRLVDQLNGDDELGTREAMVKRKRELYEKVRSAKYGAADATPEWQKIMGAAGESPERLKRRVLEEEGAARQEAERRELQQKMAGGIDSIAKAATGAGLRVQVQNFPNEPGDSPSAPPPNG